MRCHNELCTTCHITQRVTLHGCRECANPWNACKSCEMAKQEQPVWSRETEGPVCALALREHKMPLTRTCDMHFVVS